MLCNVWEAKCDYKQFEISRIELKNSFCIETVVKVKIVRSLMNSVDI